MPRVNKNKNKKRRRPKNQWNLTRAPRYPYPTSQTVKMRISGLFSLDAAAATADTHFIWANGIHDNEGLGAGSIQPYGYDQYIALYTNYTVLGSRCTVKFIRSVDTDTDADLSMVGLFLNDSSTVTANNAMTLGQRPGTKSTPLFPEDGSKTLTQNFSTKKFFSRDPRADAQLRGYGAVNPSHGAFFIAYSGSADKSATINPGLIRCYYDVDYIVLWSEPRELGSSTL